MFIQFQNAQRNPLAVHVVRVIFFYSQSQKGTAFNILSN